MNNGNSIAFKAPPMGHESLAARIEKLTPTERVVLDWVELGKRNHEIATILGSSKRTIDCHVSAILSKLNVETRGAASRLLRDALAVPAPPRTPLPKRRNSSAS